MASLNKVILMGNLTRDPEVKYTGKGTAIARLGLAVNRTWKDGNGEKQEETTFIDVDLWGRVAEIAGEYLRKGSSCLIEGRLKLDSWEDKNTGEKRTKMLVVGDTMQLLGKPAEKRQERLQELPQERPKQQERRPTKPTNEFDDYDNTVPF